MTKFTLYVDGGGTPTVPTYFSFRCLETEIKNQWGIINPIQMERFYLFNLASELLPKNCYVVDDRGLSSNNIAEFASLFYGVLAFKKFYNYQPVTIYHDSEFVVKSVLGQYQV